MKPIYIATRGSALALAQANFIQAECRREFPQFTFEIKIIKTTGDKLQSASLAQTEASLPRGLFTKELEEALLKGEADLAVHSLKDLPTILPAGLKLGATTKRADARDVLIYREAREDLSAPTISKQKRGFAPMLKIANLPNRACIGTSSTRRMAQLQRTRPDLRIIPLRGNVGTRLKKLAAEAEMDGIILAAAGLQRLGFTIEPTGQLRGEDVPEGLLATVIDCEQMLPCVGQAAIGIEIRENDPRLDAICGKLNHADTWHCVTAERAFLKATGGGCQSAVGAYAEVIGGNIRLRAISFLSQKVREGEQVRPIEQAVSLGEEMAAELITPAAA